MGQWACFEFGEDLLDRRVASGGFSPPPPRGGLVGEHGVVAPYLEQAVLGCGELVGVAFRRATHDQPGGDLSGGPSEANAV